jgi:membrane-bound ClpP family serine protease
MRNGVIPPIYRDKTTFKEELSITIKIETINLSAVFGVFFTVLLDILVNFIFYLIFLMIGILFIGLPFSVLPLQSFLYPFSLNIICLLSAIILLIIKEENIRKIIE